MLIFCHHPGPEYRRALRPVGVAEGGAGAQDLRIKGEFPPADRGSERRNPG